MLKISQIEQEFGSETKTCQLFFEKVLHIIFFPWKGVTLEILCEKYLKGMLCVFLNIAILERGLNCFCSNIPPPWKHHSLIRFLCPIFSAVNCGSAPPPGNQSTIQSSTGTIYQSTVTYVCNTGYRPVGSLELSCQANGQWNESRGPHCTGNKHIG